MTIIIIIIMTVATIIILAYIYVALQGVMKASSRCDCDIFGRLGVLYVYTIYRV